MFHIRANIPTIRIDENTIYSDLSSTNSLVTETLSDDGDYGIYDIDNEEDSIGQYKSIYSLEKQFLDSEKQNNQYVIGVSLVNTEMNVELFLCGISAKTFFVFPYHEVINYLFYFSIMRLDEDPKIDIIKIYKDEFEAFIPIKKTYWLSIIQRHWKKTHKQKKNIISKRNHLINLLYFHSFGQYPKELKELPSIKGMLSVYAFDPPITY